MKAAPPTLTLLLNVKTGCYLLARKVEDLVVRGTYIPWGDPEPISEEELRQHGLEVLLKDLAAFRERSPAAPPPGSKFKRGEWTRFVRAHKFVSFLEEAGKLQVSSTTRNAKGLNFPRELTRIVDFPRTNEEFFELLMEAFDECS